MNQIRLSLVIPVDIVEKYDESLSHFDRRDCELILFSNCADDGLSQKISSIFKSACPQIVRYEQKVSDLQCLLDAVRISKGEYVLLAEQSASIVPDAPDILMQCIQNTSADLIHFGTVVESAERNNEWRARNRQKALAPVCGRIEGNLLKACFVDASFHYSLFNKLFKGSVLRKAVSQVNPVPDIPSYEQYLMFLFLLYAESYCGSDRSLFREQYTERIEDKSIISVEEFTEFCSQTKELLAIEKLAEMPCERIASGVINPGAAIAKIKKALLRKQLNTLFSHVINAERLPAFRAMAEMWELDEQHMFEAIAANDWYRKTDFASLFPKDYPVVSFEKRPIHSIMFYYHRLNNGGVQRVMALLANRLSEEKNPDGTYRYQVVAVTDSKASDEDYALSPLVLRETIPDYLKYRESSYPERTAVWSKLIDKYAVDIVLYSAWVSPSITWDMLYIKSHPRHPAFVIHCHNYFGILYNSTGTLLRQLRNTYHLADAVVTLSESDRRYWSFLNSRTYMIMNPSFTDACAEKTVSFGKHIVWVGRISDEKQPTEMVSIMAKAAEMDPEVICHIIGKGDESLTKKLKQMITGMHLEKNVILEGFQMDMGRWYQKGSVFVSTSKFEGFPLTFYEAAAYGIPAVVYDLPWLDYFQQMKGWFAVKQGDIQATADRIVSLVNNEDEWAEASRLTKQSAEAYGKYDVLCDWHRVFDDISEGRYPKKSECDELYGSMLKEVSNFHSDVVLRLTNENNKLNKKAEQIDSLRSENEALREKQKVLEKQIIELTAANEEAAQSRAVLEAENEKSVMQEELTDTDAHKQSIFEGFKNTILKGLKNNRDR